MSTADYEPDPQPTSPFFKVATAVVVVVALAALVRSILNEEPRRPMAGSYRTSDLLGQPAPAIKAAGWLNGEAPADDYFQGKVVVVDAWAYWCRPCFEAAPELIALHEKYSDQGVVFVGLTTEQSDVLDRSKLFLEKAGITWLNGYGAIETLIGFRADAIPQMWVINRSGTIVWDYSSPDSIESAVDRALAEK